MTTKLPTLEELNDRSREVLRLVVEGYLDSGSPVGSRTLARSMSEHLSAATIRNVMQDLEHHGLLNSPHVSAGRLPTQQGLRLFVDSLLEMRHLDDGDREKLEETLDLPGSDVAGLLDRVGLALSDVTRGASLVLAPKHDSAPIKHIEFVALAPERALVVLVFADGQVENRLFTPPAGQTPSSMREAANFINAVAEGKTLAELHKAMAHEVGQRRQEIDSLARELVESGLALWVDHGEPTERLMVRGAGHLLADTDAQADIERIRSLFDELEKKKDITQFLELAEDGEGVRIFIGSENKVFSLSGSSLVVSPYMNAERKIIGAVGIIGPTRLNYGRIVPIVDYTAQLVGRILSDRT